MSEATTPKKPRKTGVILAAVLLLVAVGAFAAAIVWAGGIDGMLDMVGLGGTGGQTATNTQPKSGTKTTPGKTTGGTGTSDATSSPSATETAAAGDSGTGDPVDASGTGAQSVFPPSSAQAIMYREQLQSQPNINKLVGGQITSVAIGTAATTTTKATIPLTVSYKDGSTLSGTMTLLNDAGLWYFAGITAGGGAATPNPRTVDSQVVHVITEQQGDATCQQLIREGLVDGGFKSARVDGVTAGSGTSTVNVTLLGGSLDRKAARFVMISKVDSGKKYWFITRFELK